MLVYALGWILRGELCLCPVSTQNFRPKKRIGRFFRRFCHADLVLWSV